MNALATVSLRRRRRAALSAGDIESGAWFAAVYDSATPSMVLLSGNDRGARDGDTRTGTHDFGGATITWRPGVNLPGNPRQAHADEPATTRPSSPRQPSWSPPCRRHVTIPGQLNKGGQALVTDGTSANWGVGPAALPLLALGIV